MALPHSTLNTIPSRRKLKKLSILETSDATHVCISFWQYVSALLALESASKINANTKQVLKVLYEYNTPLTTTEISNILKLGDKIDVQGNQCLGGFGSELLQQLRKDWHNFPFPYLGKNVDYAALQVFITIIFNENESMHYCLRSQFRAALAQCYGDAVIHTW